MFPLLSNNENANDLAKLLKVDRRRKATIQASHWLVQNVRICLNLNIEIKTHDYPLKLLTEECLFKGLTVMMLTCESLSSYYNCDKLFSINIEKNKLPSLGHVPFYSLCLVNNH